MSISNTQAHRGWFPLFLNLAGRRVLVIGGGEVALRKARALLGCGAQLDILAPTPDPRVIEELTQESVRFVSGSYSDALLENMALVVIAEADGNTVLEVRRDADRRGLPVNVVDQFDHCSAITPAVIDRSPIKIAISSAGQAPELARMLRSRIEALLPASTGELARLAGSLQRKVRRRYPQLARRRRFLGWLFSGPPALAVEQGRAERARQLAEQALDQGRVDIRGSVALVGAGPGDPELLTLRALRLIQEADLIVHDGLVDPRILEYARRDAERIDVTKRRGHCRVDQEGIQRLLIEHARRGARVVRLKGGDPMIFGRGGEEITELRRHGIDYQVVPGITAASACGAYAGIPLTHRDHAQSVRLITAHCKESIDRLDWAELAADRQTLAFYMAVAKLDDIEQRLIGAGRNPNTPVALVENGTRPDQRVLLGSLSDLANLARHHELKSPAMLYVGEVAALAGELGWYGDVPLKSDCKERFEVRKAS
jgi:uroporphyrin-III C-methyltransferase / precorrin-2 dehydrogenase / sirohydrochlorin ferrochelatase